MAIILAAVLALGIGIGVSYIPTDHSLAIKMEDAIRRQMHPETVQVVLHRRNRFSHFVQRLDVNLTGFTADDLPFKVASQPVHIGGPSTGTPDTTSNTLPTTTSNPTNPDTTTIIPPTPVSVARRTIAIKVGRLHCARFTMHELPVKEMTWTFSGIRVAEDSLGTGGFNISSMRSAVGSITLDTAGITAFLQHQHLPIDSPTVTLAEDGIHLRGTVEMVVKLPIEVTGKIVARDGGVLYLDHPSILVEHVEVPDVLAARMLKQINPLINLNTMLQLPAPITITAVTHGSGLLRFDGILSLPAAE